jgi:thiol-disulfide isomerase/thioredoxin
MLNRNSGLLLIAAVVLVVSSSSSIVNGQQKSLWRYDFAQAEAEARQKDLPLLVHFYGDGCPPCEAMERRVLNTRELREQLEGNVILVKVNGNANPALRQRFSVNSWPQDFFVLPDGKVIWQNNLGFIRKDVYLNSLAGAQSQWGNIQRIHLAEKARKEKKELQIAKLKSSYLEEKDGKTNKIKTSKNPIGLRGYSPVSLTLNRKWIKGNPEITYDYRGIVFRFASLEEKEKFSETPRYFAPQLLGCDPVVLLNTDRALPGNTKFCTFFDERLYIFVSEESRKDFKINPMKYVRQRHVLKEALLLDQVERF